MESLALDAGGVRVSTPTGEIRARAVILTVSTTVLAGDSLKLPAVLDQWREAARIYRSGLNESSSSRSPAQRRSRTKRT